MPLETVKLAGEPTPITAYVLDVGQIHTELLDQGGEVTFVPNGGVEGRAVCPSVVARDQWNRFLQRYARTAHLPRDRSLLQQLLWREQTAAPGLCPARQR
jgi:hypothetical protein